MAAQADRAAAANDLEVRNPLARAFQALTTESVAVRASDVRCSRFSDRIFTDRTPGPVAGAELLLQADDDLWLATLQQASAATGVPLVAAGDVHMHVRSRKPLQDVMTAVRLGTPGGRMRLRAAAQCRAAPALTRAAGADLPGRAAGEHAGGGGALQLQPRARCKYQLPAGDGAGRPDAGTGAACASPSRARAERYPAGIAGQRAPRRSSTNWS